MVTRQAGRDAVSTLITDYNVTQLRACRVLSMFPLSTYRYKTLRQEDESLLEMIKQMAEDKKRYGMPRIHALLLRKGTRINHKRTERLYYKVLKLSLRRNKPRKQYNQKHGHPWPKPQERIKFGLWILFQTSCTLGGASEDLLSLMCSTVNLWYLILTPALPEDMSCGIWKWQAPFMGIQQQSQ